MSEPKRMKKSKAQPSAQSLVEFAVTLPVVLIILFTIIELARLLHAFVTIENGARMGVRYAVTAEYNPQYCQSGSTAEGRCIFETEEHAARVASIHDAVWAGSPSIVRTGEGEASPDETTYFNVVVCSPESLVLPADTYETHSCPPSEDPGDPGEHVIVVVEFNHPILVPLLNSVWPQLRLTAYREAIVETFRLPPHVGTPPAYNSPTPRPTNTPAPTSTNAPSPVPTLPFKLCDPPWARPSYEYLHTHTPHILSDAFGFTVHALPTTWEESGAILQTVEIRQGYAENPETLELEEITWSHPGMSSTTIEINQESNTITINPNLPMYACYSAGQCDHSLYGAVIEAIFDDDLDGQYRMDVWIYFPITGETCRIGEEVSTNPPTAVPSDTPGPSPTPEPEEPTDTPEPVATNTPEGGCNPPTSTPDSGPID